MEGSGREIAEGRAELGDRASGIPRRKKKMGRNRMRTVKELLQSRRDRAQTVQEADISLATVDELDIVNDVISSDLASETFPSPDFSRDPGFPEREFSSLLAPRITEVSIFPDIDYTGWRAPVKGCPSRPHPDRSGPSGEVERNVDRLSPLQMLTHNSNHRTLLHRAVVLGSRSLVRALARRMSHTGCLDAQDISGKTALHLAVQRNYPHFVSDLLSLGASVCVQDHLGKTPLHICAEDCLSSVLQVIKIFGPEGTLLALNKEDRNGKTPMHYAVENLMYPDIFPEGLLWKTEAYNIISGLIELGSPS